MSLNLRRLIIWSIIATGISSVTTQLLTIREFLTQFHGNEITISLVIFCWLLLAGLGSLPAKFVKHSVPIIYALLVLILAITPLFQMLAIRGLRETFFIHGASADFYTIIVYILVIIAPYCLLSGFILPYAFTTLRDVQYQFNSGRLYIIDSIGDIMGGILFSFILVYCLRPFSIIAVTSAPLVLSGLLLLFKSRRYLLLVIAIVPIFVFYYLSMNTPFERHTLTGQYGNILSYFESPYGRVVISKEGGQHTFWESGAPLYSGSNIINSEEKIHYPLCQLEQVENVLLISGGLGETITEILKYKPGHIDYVELDPNITDAALKAGVIKKSRFLEIKNSDARHYIKVADIMYDAIIIDLPDPDTFQINRFFTTEFFSLAKGILKKGGILSVSMAYAPNYLSDVRKRKLSSLYNTVRLHFRQVMILPGEYAYFLCRDGRLCSDIPARLKQKGIGTTYIEGFYYGNVTAERIRDLDAGLDVNEQINSDFKPRLMNFVFQEWFMRHKTSQGYFLLFVLLFTATYFIFMRKEEYVLFATGFVSMGVEMLIIFAFQVVYGYVYLKIGAIITAFLLGLLPGAMIGNALARKDNNRLLISELSILSMLLLFYVWIVFFSVELNQLYLLAYCFLVSFLCGFQFPVVTGMIGEKKSPVAGCLAADLIGASVGTFVTGAVLIPLWGIRFAVVFLIVVKVSSILVNVIAGRIRT